MKMNQEEFLNKAQ